MLFKILLAFKMILAPIQESLEDFDHLKGSDEAITRIYLVRHGESIFNQPDANGVIYTSGKSIFIPLTEKGEKQARGLGQKLLGKFADKEKLAIVSSTALRAEKTAKLLSEVLRQRFSVEEGGAYEDLCELGQGHFEGKPKDEEYKKEIKLWEDLSAKDKYIHPKTSDGESVDQVAQRALIDLQKIAERYEGKTILVVTHYFTMNAIALYLKGSTLSEELATSLPKIQLSNCDLLLIELPKGEEIKKATVRYQIKSKV